MKGKVTSSVREIDKWVLSGLNRFIFLFNPKSNEVVYRGGALDERVSRGDGTLASILSEKSMGRIEMLSRSIRGVHFSYGLEFLLSGGQVVSSYGSLKRVFLEKQLLILGVFYFGPDTGAKPRFRPGFSMDISRQGYWVGNLERTFFCNEKVQSAFDAVPGATHLFDLCAEEDLPALEESMCRVLEEEDEHAEYMEVAFKMADGNYDTFRFRMVRGFFADETVVRVVFLKTDSWIFQLEMNMYHRQLEMAAGRYAAAFMFGETLETALEKILADAGELLNASRGFILKLFPDLNRISMTHEWSAPGVEKVRLLSSYQVEDVKHFVDLMRKGKPALVHNKREAEEALGWKAAPHIARSFILFPVLSKGQVTRLVGFADVRFERFWTCGERKFMGKLAETMGLLIERSRLLDSLQREKTRAEEANKVKEKFLATISHEVRNPLNAIIGLSRMLMEQGVGDENPDQKQALEFIRQNGKKLSEIMENILYLSKLELHNRVPETKPLNTGELMAELESYLQGRLYGIKTVRGKVQWTKKLPQFVVTDREFLLEILMNLLDNAVKFTEKGTVSLTAERQGDDICFCVADTGIGIEPRHLERIFGDFYQVEQVDTRKHGGVGAGLAIVKRMADAIGAKVTVDSTPGKGSRFTVRVPAGEE